MSEQGVYGGMAYHSVGNDGKYAEELNELERMLIKELKELEEWERAQGPVFQAVMQQWLDLMTKKREVKKRLASLKQKRGG